VRYPPLIFLPDFIDLYLSDPSWEGMDQIARRTDREISHDVHSLILKGTVRTRPLVPRRSSPHLTLQIREHVPEDFPGGRIRFSGLRATICYGYNEGFNLTPYDDGHTVDVIYNRSTCFSQELCGKFPGHDPV
jgi:hypothetical protein